MGNYNEAINDTTEKNKNKKKIIQNIDNNMLEALNNNDIDNNINNDITNLYNDNNNDKSDDFMNITNIHEEINSSGEEKIYIWIDPEINSIQNKNHYNYLTNSKKIKILKFDNIEESYKVINKKENTFKEIIIILSGKLIYNFIHFLKKNIKSIYFSPTILIFTNKIELVTAQLKMNNMYYNNDLFDPRLIFTNPSEILDFINGNNIQEENDFTFDIIECAEQLIIPNYYSYILEDTYQYEIEYFNSYLIRNFPLNEKNKDIHMLINQIKDKVLPKEILIRYWIRIYTLQSDFYGTLNRALRSKNSKALFYYPFIKLCYEELREGFLNSSSKKLYRCSKISIKEFEEINKKIKYKDNNIEIEIPNVIVFSRCFQSFSTDKRRAKRFAKSSDGNTYSILYIIEEMENIDDIKYKISNADIKDFSNLTTEKEILVFPFTCFEIVKIIETSENKIDYEIHLKYLGNYSHYIEKNIGDKFFDKIQISKFSEELIGSGIVKAHNFISTWIKKKNLEIKLDKICFFLDGEKDCIGISKTDIIVLNISLSTIKIIINKHKDEILNVIKLPSNRICSSSKDKTIRVIKFFENNTEWQEVNTIDLYANKILFLYSDYILSLDNKNFFRIHNLNDKPFYNNELFVEENKILIVEKLNKDKVIYVSESDIGKKEIKLIDVQKGEKEEEMISIKEDNEKRLKFVDLVLFNEYILICFNSRIDIFYYQNKISYVKTFDYFDYEIIKILVLSSNRIILGFYDSVKKESTIREFILKISHLKNNKNKLDCIGKSKFETYTMDNFIKINESKILVNSKNDSCIIYKRKNEVSEKLKESLIDICITKEVKFNEIKKEKQEEIIRNKAPILSANSANITFQNNKVINLINNNEINTSKNQIDKNKSNNLVGKKKTFGNERPPAIAIENINGNRIDNKQNKNNEKKIVYC